MKKFFMSLLFIVHFLILLFVVIIGLGGVMNPASSTPDQTYWLWFSTIVIFSIIVLVSAFVTLRLNKVWVSLISVIGLIALFIFTLYYIYPFIGFILE